MHTSIVSINPRHRQNISRHSLWLAKILTIIACFFVVQVASTDHAQAGAVKKVKKGLAFTGKTLTKLEKAGRKAQRKRGKGSKIMGGILKNTARGANKVVRGTRRGVGKVSKGVNRGIRKTKVGRAAQKGWRKGQRFQQKAINKAFKKCKGRLCKGAKGAAEFAAPL